MGGLLYETGRESREGRSSATGQFAWRAAYSVEVEWQHEPGGYFTIGVSLLGGPDVLAPGLLLIPPFDGTYDALNRPRVAETEWPTRLDSIQWSRGSDQTLANTESGKASVTVVDKLGLLNPENAASPLYGLTSKPNRPIRIRTHLPWEADGLWRTQFFGYTTSLDYDPVTRVCSIDAEDLISKLSVAPTPPPPPPQPRGAPPPPPSENVGPVIPPMTNTTTGAVIGRLLDSTGWNAPALRQLATSNPITLFSADGTRTALDIAQELLSIEFGLVYVRGDGVFVYEGHRERGLKPVARSLVNEMQALGPGAALDQIINRATYLRLPDGQPQTYTDDESAHPILGYGLRPGSDVQSAWIQDDHRAYVAARHVVVTKKDPVGPLWRFEIDNRTRDQLEAMALTELSDLLEITEARTGTTGRFYVERIERTVSFPTGGAPVDTASYVLSKKTKDVFIVGQSLIGGPDVLAL